jgi:hypothetical protein
VAALVEMSLSRAAVYSVQMSSLRQPMSLLLSLQR